MNEAKNQAAQATAPVLTGTISASPDSLIILPQGGTATAILNIQLTVTYPDGTSKKETFSNLSHQITGTFALNEGIGIQRLSGTSVTVGASRNTGKSKIDFLILTVTSKDQSITGSVTARIPASQNSDIVPDRPQPEP